MTKKGPKVTSVFSQRLIDMLILEEGGRCRYCKIEVRRNFNSREYSDDDATKDHIIPRRKNGTNDRANLALACRKCNHAKGDRDLVDFLLDPRSLSERRVQTARALRSKRRNIRVISVSDEMRERDRLLRGTMAHAIASGEVTEDMTYRKAPHDIPLNPVPSMKPKHKMSALETARWLRETAEKRGRPWPLA